METTTISQAVAHSTKLIKLTVVSVTQKKNSKTGALLPSWKTKLQNKSTVTIETPFGPSSREHSETYYMDLDNALSIGFTAEIDLGKFNIVEKPFTIPEGEVGAGTTMMLKNIELF